MAKWIIAAVLLVFTSLEVAAQQQKRAELSPEERAQRMTEQMASELQLTENQKSQILELNRAHAKKRHTEMEQEKAERKEKAEEMKAFQEQLKEALTEEQRAKWEELKLERRQNRRPGGEIHERRGMPRGRGGN